MIQETYQDYKPYLQSNGIEQEIFSLARPASSRSSSILKLLHIEPQQNMRLWLDFGCGNGAFLKALHEQFPTLPLIGMEYNNQHESEVLSISGVVGFATSWDDEKLQDLQYVSMIHVLEHLENPILTLKLIMDRLVDQGILLIQVPNIWSNPYVLTVGDHATHFDMHSLVNLLEKSGFDILWKTIDFIPGELTVLAQKPRIFRTQVYRRFEPPSFAKEMYLERTQFLVAGLVETVDWLEELRKTSGTLGILGTSIAGTWAGSVLKNNHDFWVEDDIMRIGRTWFGLPILSLDQVPKNSVVALVLARSKIGGLLSRLERNHPTIREAIPPI